MYTQIKVIDCFIVKQLSIDYLKADMDRTIETRCYMYQQSLNRLYGFSRKTPIADSCSFVNVSTHQLTFRTCSSSRYNRVESD